MEHSPKTFRQGFAFRPAFVGERTCNFLRSRYPARTAENVAADLGPWNISVGTIASMIERQTAPGAILWLALIWAYGPEFLSEVHPAPLGWLSAASRAQKQQALEAKIDALRAELEELR